MRTARAAARLLAALPELVEKGNPNAASDAGSAALLLEAAAEAALLNVGINLVRASPTPPSSGGCSGRPPTCRPRRSACATRSWPPCAASSERPRAERQPLAKEPARRSRELLIRRVAGICFLLTRPCPFVILASIESRDSGKRVARFVFPAPLRRRRSLSGLRHLEAPGSAAESRRDRARRSRRIGAPMARFVAIRGARGAGP